MMHDRNVTYKPSCFLFFYIFFPLVWQKTCYGSKRPKRPCKLPWSLSLWGSTSKRKCGEKIQQGKKVYSNNKHTTQPQTFKAAWLTPKWLSSAHPETYQTHIYGCFFTVYDRGTVTSTQLWPTFDTKTWTQTQISTQLSFPPCCATDPVHAANARK